MKEIWKYIPWYEWKYWASNLWKIKWKKWILKPWYTNTDYIVVSLCNWSRNNYTKTWVHRLVLSAFKWKSNLDCNHIDWNKKNNNLENLEWVTKSENMKHAIKNWLINISKWKDHYLYWVKWKDSRYSKKVNQLDIDWNLIKTWDSLADVNRELWISQWNIVTVCKWKRNHTWWFKWSYYWQ